MSQRQQKGGGDGRLYSKSMSELASAKIIIDAGSLDNIASTEMVGLIRIQLLITHLRINQFSSTIPALIPSFRTDGSRLWICASWSINPSFLSPASGHLRIDLIGRRVRNEHSGLTAGIPIGLHQRKMELSNHG